MAKPSKGEIAGLWFDELPDPGFAAIVEHFAKAGSFIYRHTASGEIEFISPQDFYVVDRVEKAG